MKIENVELVERHCKGDKPHSQAVFRVYNIHGEFRYEIGIISNNAVSADGWYKARWVKNKEKYTLVVD